MKEINLLFESTLQKGENKNSYFFTNPIDSIIVKNSREILIAFDKINLLSKKYYLAGFISYETGYYFLEEQLNETNFEFPLICFFVFDKINILKTKKEKEKIYEYLFANEKEKNYKITKIKLTEGKNDYFKKLKKIKEYIYKGETYQVNYSIKYYFNFFGNAFKFYEELKLNQQVNYSAYLDFDSFKILSFSPELFFKKTENKIYLKPMKGTIKRGRNLEEDRYMRIKLKSSEKEKAENLMIVDLLRNDVGQLSLIGSVKVDKLFSIEKYKTIFQMTSSISALLKDEINYYDIFKALFPSGSVTGAPKIRTMEIIKELEKENRNIYCGSIGIIFPDNQAIFNVAIRTLLLNKNKGEIGIGSGITYDSIIEDEFDECILKAEFLKNKNVKFKIIETILWYKKYYFLEEHLIRLKKSAKYFDYHYSQNKIKERLIQISRLFQKRKRYKVRILLSEDNFDIYFEELIIDKREKFITISKKRTNTKNIFLYHKTTNRELYNKEFNKYRKKGFYDVLFMNEKDEITEGTFNNVIIEKNNKIITPPIECGLLNGIYREYLIKKKRIKEEIIKYNDLKNAEKIYLCNSVRGLVEVLLR
ncbi:MAG TPA: aminodeoxychorismate synthase component I [bacterium]|nr:aminodeoxychorismate synthase component I [bacterium]HOL47889.1 aminodeoxychorismate synthase component I [bacterium]HPQ19673.1 aminodeoxychorismate synthase component I [bacterium]